MSTQEAYASTAWTALNGAVTDGTAAVGRGARRHATAPYPHRAVPFYKMAASLLASSTNMEGRALIGARRRHAIG